MNTGADSLTIEIADLAALQDFAQQLAGVLAPGDVMALNGPMGAGKTTLVQALGRALGIPERIVSPTFVLIHDYVSGRWPLVHVDLYRLGPEGAGAVAEEVLSVVGEGRSVLAVEWAEYGEFLTSSITMALDIEVMGEARRIRVTATPAVLSALQAGVTR